MGMAYHRMQPVVSKLSSRLQGFHTFKERLGLILKKLDQQIEEFTIQLEKDRAEAKKLDVKVKARITSAALGDRGKLKKA